MFCEIDNALADDFILKSSQPDFFLVGQTIHSRLHLQNCMDSLFYAHTQIYYEYVHTCVNLNQTGIHNTAIASSMSVLFSFTTWRLMDTSYLATPRCFRISAVCLPCEVPTLDLESSCQELQYYFKFNFEYSGSDLFYSYPLA